MSTYHSKRAKEFLKNPKKVEDTTAHSGHYVRNEMLLRLSYQNGRTYASMQVVLKNTPQPI